MGTNLRTDFPAPAELPKDVSTAGIAESRQRWSHLSLEATEMSWVFSSIPAVRRSPEATCPYPFAYVSEWRDCGRMMDPPLSTIGVKPNDRSPTGHPSPANGTVVSPVVTCWSSQGFARAVVLVVPILPAGRDPASAHPWT